jgi:Protein of unknown function (DUF1592)/Protein of unknown function (DUF1588)/Protein of unknown function (DUF1585)/Protein of unknown function (DUF1595)/Protein of unknown function (DUF1587)
METKKMRPRRLKVLSLAAPLLGAVLLAGCEGILGDPDDKDPGKDPTAECSSDDVAVAASPLRRLSRTEYLRTVRILIDPIQVPALEIGPDKTVDGFDNNEKTQTVTPDLVNGYFTAAAKIGEAVSANAAAFAGCSYGTPAEAQECAGQVARTFGRRAYRRPLTFAEQAAFETFLVNNAEKHGFETALGMFAQAVLLSPHFLYRPEWGVPDPATPEALPLGSYELASRLSYFLWQSMPDDALLSAAESGDLETPEGLRAEAERLLADPRAREVVADFHRQWMDLDKMKTMSRDTDLFPAWNDATVPPVLAEATAKYLDHVFWDSEGSVAELFTAPKAYVNDTIAPLYGIEPPGTDELTLVDLDPTQRAGILTQVGPMAAMAHEKFDAPIVRGVFVLRRLLCVKLGAPPPDVADIPPSNESDAPMTTRQRIELTHIQPTCLGCHEKIDALGFAFNHYDAAGQWRTQENGLPIDATGELPELGSYNGAIEVSEKLAASEDVRSCVVTQWFRFAMGRTEKPEDQCAIEQLTSSFTEGGGTMRDLLLDIVMSDSFRYRSPMGGTP